MPLQRSPARPGRRKPHGLPPPSSMLLWITNRLFHSSPPMVSSSSSEGEDFYDITENGQGLHVANDSPRGVQHCCCWPDRAHSKVFPQQSSPRLSQAELSTLRTVRKCLLFKSILYGAEAMEPLLRRQKPVTDLSIIPANHRDRYTTN